MLTSILVFIQNYLFVFRLRTLLSAALCNKRTGFLWKVPRIFSKLNIIRKWIVLCKYFGSLPSNSHCSLSTSSSNRIYTHFIARSYLVFISHDNRKTNFKSTFTAGGWYSRDTWHVGDVTWDQRDSDLRSEMSRVCAVSASDLAADTRAIITRNQGSWQETTRL